MNIPRVLRGRRPQVLALAATASLLELGPIAVLLREGVGLQAILTVAIAYQFGNISPKPLTLHYAVLASTSLLAVAGLILAPTSSTTWFASIATLSWSLQAVRRRLTASPGDDLPSTAQKRTARVLGFIAATIMPLGACVALAGVAAITALAWPTPQTNLGQPTSIKGKVHPLELAMVLHQSHYFSYCYAVPVLVSADVIGGTPLVGTWFALGWMTYLSAETLWKNFPPPLVFVTGHGFLAVLLIIMALVSHVPWAVASLWILSGIGGGTVLLPDSIAP